MEIFAAHDLRTPRMRLRRLTEADAPHLVALHGDPDVMRFLGDGKPVPRAEVLERTLPVMLARQGHRNMLGYRAAEKADTGEFLGWFELVPANRGNPGEVELGFRLLPSAWGHGYATEGARALVRAAFTVCGARRVMGTTMAVNTASRRVMEKAGLRYVRTFHEEWPDPIEGAEHGDVEYALDLADWRA
ncbi:GNAT family N-acetyltransferase [Streptomyces sp. NPDC018019]|uniref:GNAT family N-acetyltransferase n=1 Tax=Streptomyces sp. NPDC018019 TaxID=3365030 RepID=UPI0037B6583A